MKRLFISLCDDDDAIDYTRYNGYDQKQTKNEHEHNRHRMKNNETQNKIKYETKENNSH